MNNETTNKKIEELNIEILLLKLEIDKYNVKIRSLNNLIMAGNTDEIISELKELKRQIIEFNLETEKRMNRLISQKNELLCTHEMYYLFNDKNNTLTACCLECKATITTANKFKTRKEILEKSLFRMKDRRPAQPPYSFSVARFIYKDINKYGQSTKELVDEQSALFPGLIKRKILKLNKKNIHIRKNR